VLGVLLILSSDATRAAWFILTLSILAIRQEVYFLLGPLTQTVALLIWRVGPTKDSLAGKP
jgi:hypothetical protein